MDELLTPEFQKEMSKQPTYEQIKELLKLGFRFASQWQIRIRVKVPTRYFTDTAGNLHTA